MREDSDGYDTLGDDDAHDTIPDGTLVAGGRLRVGEWIARGAMATVYQAIEVASGRKVALKVLGGKYADLPDAEPRLFAEAKYAAKLGNHPNIVEPLYWGNLDEWHGRAYLVSEIVEGPTLKGYLLGHEVSTAAICELLRDVAAVLADVHGLGIIHRDVKPSNVLVAEEDGVLIPKLTDFGLATTLDRLEPSLADARLTQEFERLGTKHYMAPEQCLGLPLTMACDVYALGVTAFECFVGSPPWGGRAEVEVVQRKCDATQPSFSLARMQLGLPERLATIVDAALAFDPAARPSAREFHDELAAVVRALQRGDAGFVDVPTRELVRRASERVDVDDDAPTVARVPALAIAPSSPVIVESAPRRRPRLVVLAVAAICAAGIGLAIATVDRDPSLPPSPLEVAPAAALDEAAAPVAVPRPASATGGHAPASLPPRVEADEPGKAAVDTAPRSAPRPRVKPTSPPAVPAYETDACRSARERAEAAARARSWAAVSTHTRKAACWQDRDARLRLVVRALSRTSDYAGCVAAGRASSDPAVASTVEFCRQKVNGP